MMSSNLRFSLLTGALIIVFSLSSSCVPGLIDLRKKPYVPIDLGDCLVHLDTTLSQAARDTLTSWTEEDLPKAHFGLGMWIRNEWGLWSKSRLAKWFNAQGVWHPDDMSGIILTSYLRHLHNKPIALDDQIYYYTEYWKDHSYPDTLKCILCGKKLQSFYKEGPGVDPDYPDEVTFVLFCSNKHPLFYSKRHGLYGIDEAKNQGLLDTFELRFKR